MSIVIYFVFLPIMLLGYGLGYMLARALDVQGGLTASWFKVPMLFSLFGMKHGRILSGMFYMALAIWIYMLLA